MSQCKTNAINGVRTGGREKPRRIDWKMNVLIGIVGLPLLFETSGHPFSQIPFRIKPIEELSPPLS
jgi:hypothetical protein